MATAVTCDWCGEPIEYSHEHPPTLSTHGLDNNGRLIGSKGSQYHHDRPMGSEPSCLLQAFLMLEQQSRWAHRDEDADAMRWTLVERSRPERGLKPGSDEYSELYRESDLHEWVSYKQVHALIQAGYPSLEQLVFCERSELRDLDGVGIKSIRRLETALAERGLSVGSMVGERD